MFVVEIPCGATVHTSGVRDLSSGTTCQQSECVMSALSLSLLSNFFTVFLLGA